jgi:hypothetical protein
MLTERIHNPTHENAGGIVTVGAFTSHGHHTPTTLCHHAFYNCTRHHVAGKSVSLRHQEHATASDSVHRVQQSRPFVQLSSPRHTSVSERAHQLQAVLLTVQRDGVQLGFEPGTALGLFVS